MCKKQPDTKEGLTKEFLCYQNQLQKLRNVKSKGNSNKILRPMSKEQLKSSITNIRKIIESNLSKKSHK